VFRSQTNPVDQEREVAEKRKFARAENENENEPGSEKVIDRWSKARVRQSRLSLISFPAPTGFILCWGKKRTEGRRRKYVRD